MDKPSLFVHKEMSFFCFSDDRDWRKFSVFTVSMLHVKDQVCPIYKDEHGSGLDWIAIF